MSRLITLKFSEIIFAVFTMLKMNVVIKEIEITMMVFLSLMIFFRIWLMNVDKKIVFKYVKRNTISQITHTNAIWLHVPLYHKMTK